MEEIGSKDYGN